jgi:uncharacterized OB-fold protein
MNAVPIPRPAGTGIEGEFWARVHEGVLAIQRCGECGEWQHPPLPVCRTCSSRDLAFAAVSGRGEIWSYTICHPPVLAAYADRVPYNAIVVRLAEGPFLVSNLTSGDPADLAVGRAVHVVFDRIDDSFTLPRFRPNPT